MATGWICKRCETANSAGIATCEVCNSPLLYTQEELEEVVKLLVKEAEARIKAAIVPAATPAPAPAPAAPVPATNCDGAWILSFIFGFVAIGLFLFIVLLFSSVPQ